MLVEEKNWLEFNSRRKIFSVGVEFEFEVVINTQKTLNVILLAILAGGKKGIIRKIP